MLVLNRLRESGRSLAESIPPSARKALSAISVLDAVERAGFPPNRGNVVWWGDAPERLESFNNDDGAFEGFLVLRPALDALLIGQAEAAGAEVRTATVVGVRFDGETACVDYEDASGRSSVRAAYVLDCSGRAGVIARRGLRAHEPHHRMQALLGMWRCANDSPFAADDRTLVETYDDGWAWSLAIAPGERQVAVMVDGATSRVARGRTIADTYVAELKKTRRLSALVDDAVLEQAWACDASMYSSTAFSGDRFLLVGDAAASLDPLSSFGVKKAIASAWLAAVAVHTALIDEARREIAFSLFAARERDIHAADRALTHDFAQRAFEHHGSTFWSVRRGEPAPVTGRPPSAEDALFRSPQVRDAHDRLRGAANIALQWNEELQRVKQPIVRGNEIVLEDAVPIATIPTRFVSGIDLIALGGIAVRHRQVPDAYESYCSAFGGVPLPAFLSVLSLLIAERVLELR